MLIVCIQTSYIPSYNKWKTGKMRQSRHCVSPFAVVCRNEKADFVEYKVLSILHAWETYRIWIVCFCCTVAQLDACTIAVIQPPTHIPAQHPPARVTPVSIRSGRACILFVF